MNTVRPHEEYGQPETPAVAVVLCRTEDDNLHAGILHRKRKKPVQALHLAWQDRLSDEWEWEGIWVPPPLPGENAFAVAALCRRIWRLYGGRRKFPYALAYLGTTFDERGELVLAAGAKGLTCATFILAVFGAFKVELIDESEWPIRRKADQKFLKFIQEFASPEHFAVLKREVERGVRRIWPDEVLAACLKPMSEFEVVRAQADELVRVLDAQSR